MQGQQGELLQSCSHFSVLPIIPPALCFGLLIVSSLGDGEERKLVTLLAIIQLENKLCCCPPSCHLSVLLVSTAFSSKRTLLLSLV